MSRKSVKFNFHFSDWLYTSGPSNLNQPRATHLSVGPWGGPHAAKLGELYIDFPRNFKKRIQSLATKVGYLEPKDCYDTFWFYDFIDSANA